MCKLRFRRRPPTGRVGGGNVLTQALEGRGVKISLDRSMCAGHAMCNAVAPELFPLDDEGYSILEPHVVAAGDVQRARDGVAACPEGALSIDEQH